MVRKEGHCPQCQKYFVVKYKTSKPPKFCSTACRNKAYPLKGNRNPAKNPEVGLKISSKLMAEKSPNWKGGITKLPEIFRHRVVYKRWRLAVLERDAYTCQRCYLRKDELIPGLHLEVHHIKSFLEYPELRYDLTNGETLCNGCHIRPGRPKRLTSKELITAST